MRPSAFVIVAGFAAFTGSASAEPARVNLTYARKGATATPCPDEATFRTLVAARLGYDPFDSGGGVALLVELRPQGAEVVGRLALTGERGEKRGQRTLRSGDMDCFELASSMALAAAVAIDPEAVRTRTAPAPPATPAPPAPAAPSAAPTVLPPRSPEPDVRGAAPRPRSHFGLRVTAGFVLPAGITPEPGGGVRGGAGLDAGTWSLAAEGAFLFPSSHRESFGEVSASVGYGSLVPCVHPRPSDALVLDFCVVASAGALFSEAAKVTRSAPSADLFATVGPRAGIAVMPWSKLGFLATVDVPVSLHRVHLFIDDGGQRREVWAASWVGVVGGISMVLRLR